MGHRSYETASAGPGRDVVNRRRSRRPAEAARSAQPSPLEQIVTSAPGLMALVDVEMRYLAHSASWAAMVGEAGDSTLVGRSHYDVVPALPENEKAGHRRAIAGEVSSGSETSYRFPGGRLAYLTWTCQPWHTAAGTIGGVLLGYVDRTETVALREADDRKYYELWNASHQGLMLAFEPGWHLVDANKQACFLLGAEDAEHLARFTLDALAPERQPDGTLSTAAARAYIEATGLVSGPWTCRGLDGRERTCRITVDPVTVRNQRAVRIRLEDISELAATAQLLETRESQLISVLRLAQAGGWEYFLDTNEVVLTPEYYAVFRTSAAVQGGYRLSLDDWTQRFIVPGSHDAFRVRFAAASSAIPPGGVSDTVEFEAIFGDGTRGWCEGCFQPRVDATGRVTGYRGVTLDITARKAAEADLQHTRDVLMEAQQLGRIGSFEYVPGTGTLVWSAELKRLHGLDPQGPTPSVEAALALLLPEDRAPTVASFEQFLRGVEDGVWEFRIMLPDGRLRYLRTRARHDRGRQQVVGTTQDISTRKAQEALLEAARASLEEAQAFAATGSCEFDPATEQVVASVECLRLFMVDAPAGPTMPLRALAAHLTSEDWDHLQNALTQTRTRGVSSDGRYRLCGPGGAPRWLHVHWHDRAAAENKERRLIGIVRDCTSEELATLARQEAQLAIASATKAKEDFYRTLSHELRTPLHAILGATELLLGESETQPVQKASRWLKTIYTSGQHLLTLINDVLEWSRLSSGHIALDLEPIDLPELWDLVFPLILPLASPRRIDVRYTETPGLPRVQGDRRRLARMMVNLLTNAVKFTPDGGAVALWGTYHPARNVVQIHVRDSGIGIAPEHQEKIFEPFVQADPATDRRFEGVGLGLALTKCWAEEHHGTLSLVSELGVGTTVTLELPVLGPTVDVSSGDT